MSLLTRHAVMLAAAIIPWCANASDELVRKGDDAHDRHDERSAMAFYEKAHAADSSSYEASWKLARACNDVGESTRDKVARKRCLALGEAASRRAIRLNPSGAKGYLQRGIALGRLALDTTTREKMSVAREIRVQFEKAVQLDPSEDLAWCALGLWFRSMATLNWVERGFVDLLFGGVPEDATVANAVRCFQRACAVRPDRANYHLELGISYEAAGDNTRACDEFRKVLSLPVTESDGARNKEHARKRLARLGG